MFWSPKKCVVVPIKRFLLGSVTEMVLRHAPCEVLVLRRVD